MGWITGPGGFPGLVAGVIVQACANALMLGWQRNNAKEVLRCGLEMNLHEVRLLKDRIESLKQRISANQADPPDLWITMLDFDHSALNPLVTSGHFHKMPGSDGVKRYLSGSRFFNNENAARLSQMLQGEHARQGSLQFMEWLEGRVAEEEGNFGAVMALLWDMTPGVDSG